MRKAGKLAAETLDFIAPYVQPGVTTGELDKLCHDFIQDHGAIPAPLGYRGFPKSICTSINHVVCHGIPGDKRLQNGDIVNIDVTPILDGWYGDTSRMFFAGEPKLHARRLVNTCYEAMCAGIRQVRPGATLGSAENADRTGQNQRENKRCEKHQNGFQHWQPRERLDKRVGMTHHHAVPARFYAGFGGENQP